ncbi:LysR family transcriptional regulator [Salinivibrio sp. YCSC6]|uniref:LysR family transcriptional regulator n=1 Tax=Salinivibrio sp. YCSC6 TaxID=2003370 RepID=UPI00352BC006
MDIQLLRTFIEVSKTRHFGHAADNLYLTQSAVSFRIRQLETQLGAPLFIRQRGNVRLTSAGERMLPYAETLLQTWQRAQQDVTLTQAANEQLTIGASPTLWELEGVSDWINRICANQPDWVIRAEATPRQMLARQLIEKRIDAGLTSELPKLEGLHSHQPRRLSIAIGQPPARCDHGRYPRLSDRLFGLGNPLCCRAKSY